jgi:hypothetical protein
VEASRLSRSRWLCSHGCHDRDAAGLGLFEGAFEHIDRLAEKYLGQDKYPYLGPDKRVIIQIHPERVDGFGVGG